MARTPKEYDLDWDFISELMSSPHRMSDKEIAFSLGIPYTTFIDRVKKCTVRVMVISDEH